MTQFYILYWPPMCAVLPRNICQYSSAVQVAWSRHVSTCSMEPNQTERVNRNTSLQRKNVLLILWLGDVTMKVDWISYEFRSFAPVIKDLFRMSSICDKILVKESILRNIDWSSHDNMFVSDKKPGCLREVVEVQQEPSSASPSLVQSEQWWTALTTPGVRTSTWSPSTASEEDWTGFQQLAVETWSSLLSRRWVFFEY